MDLDASTLRFNLAGQEWGKRDEERGANTGRWPSEKCPAGSGPLMPFRAIYTSRTLVPSRSKGVSPFASLRCRLLSELPIHGGH